MALTPEEENELKQLEAEEAAESTPLQATSENPKGQGNHDAIDDIGKHMEHE